VGLNRLKEKVAHHTKRKQLSLWKLKQGQRYVLNKNRCKIDAPYGRCNLDMCCCIQLFNEILTEYRDDLSMNAPVIIIYTWALVREDRLCVKLSSTVHNLQKPSERDVMIIGHRKAMFFKWWTKVFHFVALYFGSLPDHHIMTDYAGKDNMYILDC
jgi:hypothetical protein